jgi:hypothetical protein
VCGARAGPGPATTATGGEVQCRAVQGQWADDVADKGVLVREKTLWRQR